VKYYLFIFFFISNIVWGFVNNLAKGILSDFFKKKITEYWIWAIKKSRNVGPISKNHGILAKIIKFRQKIMKNRHF